MKLYFERRILAGIFVVVAIFIGLGVYTYSTNQQSLATGQRVSHTNSVLYHIEQIRSASLHLEAELFRYKATGDTSFLSFYKQILHTTGDHIGKLRTLVSDNSVQMARIDSFIVLGRKKMEMIQHTLDGDPDPEKRESPGIPSMENRNLMKELDRLINAMGDEENRLLAVRMNANQSQIEKFN